MPNEGGMEIVRRTPNTKLNRDAATHLPPPARAKDAEQISRFKRKI